MEDETKCTVMEMTAQLYSSLVNEHPEEFLFVSS